MNDDQQLRVALAWRIELRCRLVARVRLEDLVAAQSGLHARGQGLQRLDDALLPVDQRAVTIEGQYFELRESHVSLSCFLGLHGEHEAISIINRTVHAAARDRISDQMQ